MHRLGYEFSQKGFWTKLIYQLIATVGWYPLQSCENGKKISANLEKLEMLHFLHLIPYNPH